MKKEELETIHSLISEYLTKNGYTPDYDLDEDTLNWAWFDVKCFGDETNAVMEEYENGVSTPEFKKVLFEYFDERLHKFFRKTWKAKDYGMDFKVMIEKISKFLPTLKPYEQVKLDNYVHHILNAQTMSFKVEGMNERYNGDCDLLLLPVCKFCGESPDVHECYDDFWIKCVNVNCEQQPKVETQHKFDFESWCVLYGDYTHITKTLSYDMGL